jgi:alkanesulfonate monooxygenase SsuD/methylene tetrahydromethanopterin reductase-like flavin-dependent oxidoreductase (luciferase family)
VKFGYIVTAGEPRTIADLAAEAEESGWDGVFYYDAIAIGDDPMHDPWVVMTAMAMRTERVRIGAILTPPARRRPWKLAREAMSLDRVSGGRLVLPVGLGVTDDAGFGNVGEPTDNRIRGELLDESLEILAGLWSGEPFAFEGRHYHFGPMTFRPPPVQRPRIPIWVAASWRYPKSISRAVRWDGVLPQTDDPETIRQIVEFARQSGREGIGPGGWDVVVDGKSRPGDARAVARVKELARAGATWWVEADWEHRSVDSMRARIAAGPPKVAAKDVATTASTR